RNEAGIVARPLRFFGIPRGRDNGSRRCFFFKRGPHPSGSKKQATADCFRHERRTDRELREVGVAQRLSDRWGLACNRTWQSDCAVRWREKRGPSRSPARCRGGERPFQESLETFLRTTGADSNDEPGFYAGL